MTVISTWFGKRASIAHFLAVRKIINLRCCLSVSVKERMQTSAPAGLLLASAVVADGVVMLTLLLHLLLLLKLLPLLTLIMLLCQRCCCWHCYFDLMLLMMLLMLLLLTLLVRFNVVNDVLDAAVVYGAVIAFDCCWYSCCCWLWMYCCCLYVSNAGGGPLFPGSAFLSNFNKRQWWQVPQCCGGWVMFRCIITVTNYSLLQHAPGSATIINTDWFLWYCHDEVIRIRHYWGYTGYQLVLLHNIHLTEW